MGVLVVMVRVAAFFIIMKMRHRSNVVHGVRIPRPSHSFLHPRLQCPNLSLIPRPTIRTVLSAKLSVKPNQRALFANSATNTRFSSSLVSRHRSRSSNNNSKTGLPAFRLERQASIHLLLSAHGPTWQTQPKTNLRCLRKSQRKSQCKSLRKNHCKSQRKSQCRSQCKSQCRNQRKNPG